jgi:hypothetical protein
MGFKLTTLVVIGTSSCKSTITTMTVPQGLGDYGDLISGKMYMAQIQGHFNILKKHSEMSVFQENK